MQKDNFLSNGNLLRKAKFSNLSAYKYLLFLLSFVSLCNESEAGPITGACTCLACITTFCTWPCFTVIINPTTLPIAGPTCATCISTFCYAPCTMAFASPTP
ncbi:MAG: hypothetical protein GY830_07385 [Bacteroidetes bacterium]|nr:hypothetical protein [Bacteroidota bacterium]